MEVIIKERAQRSIRRIARFIFDKGYPETAMLFAIRLDEFAKSLGVMPEKYQICIQKSYARKKFRCVPFENNYVFIYKIANDKVYVLNIVQAARIR